MNTWMKTDVTKFINTIHGKRNYVVVCENLGPTLRRVYVLLNLLTWDVVTFAKVPQD